MKRFLLSLFLFLSMLVSASAQTVKFWGIPFGTPKQKTLEMMKEKGAEQVLEQNGVVVFENLPLFAGFRTTSAGFTFTEKGEFAMALLYLYVKEAPEINEEVIQARYQQAKEVQALLEKKYGKPQAEDGEVDEEFLIAAWEIESYSIFIVIDEDADLYLQYQENALVDQAQKAIEVRQMDEL